MIMILILIQELTRNEAVKIATGKMTLEKPYVC